MAFDLNPITVTAAPLLRAIAAGGWTSDADLARRAGRVPNHIARDLGALEKPGLITRDPIALTDEGRAQLEALDRAANPETAGAPAVLFADLEPHPLNPRKDFETAEAEDALDELRTSIVKKGVLQPILIRPRADAPGKWWIIAGERRWRAVGQAIFDGDWEEDRPIPVTIREVNDAEHLLLALTENLQRSNMSAIEEAVAFALAVSEHGQSTDALADATGKSQRFIQQRIALLKLPQTDQDRMRLPRDHPDHLSFKAARAMTQTARETPAHVGIDLASGPDRTAEVEISRDAEGRVAVEDIRREPGSPPSSPTPEDAAKFGQSLTDREALAFVELVDKAERHPAADAALAAEGYTEVADARHPVKEDLIQKGLMAVRYRGGETPHARAYLMTSGAKAWLEDIGFYQHREDVLFELRVRVHGVNAADQHRAEGTYATAWLTPSTERPQQAVEDGIAKTWNTDQISHAREQGWSPEAQQVEAEQPALIEETEEERAARRSADRERAAITADREVAQRLSDDVVRALAEARSGAKPYGDALSGNGSNEGLAALVAAAFGALASAEPELAAAAIAQLIVRGGAMGARYALQQRTLPEIERMMLNARVARRDFNRGDALDDAEPDPVEDFIQAELEDAEADAGGTLDPGPHWKPGPGEPAVPIRKSITPDFIVCLEDGRKFKSLKRHLRVKYNLSPDEYRAKWGLPADYPMVAPNYAKARADLARQMGLEPDA